MTDHPYTYSSSDLGPSLDVGPPAYVGPSGRTRVGRVRVFRQGRGSIEVEVYRVVNVAANPELRVAAIRGTLHRLDDGEVIDVPFIYHDPAGQLFVLVIPHAARGRELSERAKLLDSLMKEHEKDVPDYVRHFAIVYGRDGLGRYLDHLETMEVEVAELEPLYGPPLDPPRYTPLPTLLPPAEFRAYATTELAPLIEDDELWIFVEVGADAHEAFEEAGSDLLIQLKMVHQIAISILALTDRQTSAVRRAYLNPQRSGDRRILELLRRDFHARLVVYTENRTLLRSFRLQAPREANAKMILDRSDLAAEAPTGRWEEAVGTCRMLPLPIGRADHPFVREDVASCAVEAFERLERLEAWTSPGKIEEALLVVSVPMTVFELSQRRLVSDAVGFGLAMSNELMVQAVAFGLAPDVQRLLAVLEQNFQKTLSAASGHGLSESQIQANWKALLDLGQIHGTSTAPGLSCTMDH
ncbi:MAG: CpXC domain-containing protein [Deltaproteobacteria bacterium]|nr:CpXC domain-containing protein [Deltaproteobacteria bacterium]